MTVAAAVGDRVDSVALVAQGALQADQAAALAVAPSVGSEDVAGLMEARGHSRRKNARACGPLAKKC